MMGRNAWFSTTPRRFEIRAESTKWDCRLVAALHKHAICILCNTFESGMLKVVSFGDADLAVESRWQRNDFRFWSQTATMDMGRIK
jgi:hypothetical protein